MLDKAIHDALLIVIWLGRKNLLFCPEAARLAMGCHPETKIMLDKAIHDALLIVIWLGRKNLLFCPEKTGCKLWVMILSMTRQVERQPWHRGCYGCIG